MLPYELDAAQGKSDTYASVCSKLVVCYDRFSANDGSRNSRNYIQFVVVFLYYSHKSGLWFDFTTRNQRA